MSAMESPKSFTLMFNEDHKMMLSSEIMYLASLVEVNKPKRILQIGAGIGVSAATILEYSDQDVVMWSVDASIDSGLDNKAHGIAVGLAVEFRNLAKLGLPRPGQCFTQLLGRSSDIAWNEQIDLLFVDGGHTYEDCLGDLEKYAPFVTVNGAVIVHDYNVDGYNAQTNRTRVPFPGVDRAAQEYFSGNEKFRQYPCAGTMGLWVRQ